MKHKKTRGEKLLYLSYHIGLVLTALLPAGCARQAASEQKTEVTSAVYIEHTGESNKSILPVVIFAKSPSEAELKRIIGDVVWDMATMVNVSNDDLRRIIAVTYKFFQTTQKDAKGHKFGTFCVTIVEGKTEKKRILPDDKIELSRTLSPEAMMQLLNAIEEVERSSASGNEELRKTVGNLKGHLNLKRRI